MNYKNGFPSGTTPMWSAFAEVGGKRKLHHCRTIKIKGCHSNRI